MVPTGNQANFALELLIKETAKEFHHAVEPLSHHRYVDDVVSADGYSRRLRDSVALNASVK